MTSIKHIWRRDLADLAKFGGNSDASVYLVYCVIRDADSVNKDWCEEKCYKNSCDSQETCYDEYKQEGTGDGQPYTFQICFIFPDFPCLIFFFSLLIFA